jgi:arylformamidase
MRLIDLTMSLNAETPTYPGDPKAEFTRIATCEKDGWNEHRISMNTHFGTHIDAPWHMLPNGKRLTEYPIDRFVGMASVVDVRGMSTIDADLDSVGPGEIVLLRTDRTELAGSPAFYEGIPVLSAEFARKCIARRVSIVGMDTYTPDEPPFEIHKLLLAADVLILENVVALSLLPPGRFRLFVMPVGLWRKSSEGTSRRGLEMHERAAMRADACIGRPWAAGKRPRHLLNVTSCAWA